MADKRSTEPESNFSKFVREMSEAAARMEEFDENPERVMSEAGLSEEEKELVRAGDEEAILTALGQEGLEALPIITIMRVRFRRRRKPPVPPKLEADGGF